MISAPGWRESTSFANNISCRSGKMMFPSAVYLAVDLQHFATESAVELARSGSCDAVAAVDGNFHGTRKPHVRSDAIQIGLADLDAAVQSGTAGELARLDPPPQLLDVLAGKGRSREHHLQSVVLGRIMAARDRDCAAAAQFVRCEIGHRGCEHPDLRHVHAACADALHQRSSEVRPGEPSVAAHCDLRPAGAAGALEKLAAERLSDQSHGSGRKRLPDHAADVVGLEYCLRG